MILVTGAAGKTGQAIIQALAERRAPIRALVYRAEQVAQIKQLGAQETIVGDMKDETIFDQAMRGVSAIYHICPNMNPDEIAVGQIAIGAAQTNGLEYFVYHSVLHPQTESMPHHWHKLRVEEMLFASGLAYTILQPAAYMQNVLTGWPAITGQGVYRVPYSMETRLSMVALEDVAAAAAIVLTEPGHTGAIYELAGSDPLSQIDIAAILTQALGRPVVASQIPINEWTGQAEAAGLSSYQIKTLIKMFRYYEQYGFWGNPRVLGWLLGRPPTTFRAFIESHIAHNKKLKIGD